MTISFLDFLNNLISMPNFLILTILISGVMFVNGGTDAPNSIATCISTRCLSPNKALGLAVIFDFLGILIMTLINSTVAETIFNIVDFGENTHNALIALCAALISIVLWSVIAWFFGIPTSESHSLIAGLSGSAIALQKGIAGINFEEWKKVLYGLIIVNILGFVSGFLITRLIEKICKNMDRRKTNKFFEKLQIVSAASMAFMHGAQDGQKFMGVFLLGAMLATGSKTTFSIPLWLTIYCAILMAAGAIIGGRKIIKTVGMKMAKLEKYQGSSADIASTLCLFGSSILGIPLSTTHIKTTAIMGVGTSRGLSRVNWGVAKNMILTWIFTFPGCGLIGYFSTLLFIRIF